MMRVSPLPCTYTQGSECVGLKPITINTPLIVSYHNTGDWASP